MEIEEENTFRFHISNTFSGQEKKEMPGPLRTVTAWSVFL